MFSADTGAGFNEQIDLLFAQDGGGVRIVQEVNGVGSMLGLVAAGLGITVISQSLSALRTQGVVYRALMGEGSISRLWLIRGPDPSPIARAFVRLLRDGEI